MELNILIGLICTILGIILSYLAFRRNERNDIKSDVKDDTKDKVQLNTKIDILLTNNTEIKGEIKDINNKFDKFKDDFGERLTRVEESTKSAHKRLDILEKEGK